MRFEEVLPALRAGKLIRCKDNDEVFFYLLDGDLVRQAYIPAFEEWIVCNYSITGKEVLRDDWEVVADIDEVLKKGCEE